MATRKQQEPGSEPGEAGEQAAQGEGRQAQGERQGRAQSQHGEELDFESLREHGRALREAAGGFREATQQALADAESMARSGVQERPYTLLGVAFATGWVLGGGVPVRIASLATGAVGRAALGLAAARLAEMQTNGSGGSARRREGAREGARESGARADV
jgi:hypothetical protein